MSLAQENVTVDTIYPCKKSPGSDIFFLKPVDNHFNYNIIGMRSCIYFRALSKELGCYHYIGRKCILSGER